MTTTSTDGRSRRWDLHRAQRRGELVHAATRAVHHEGPDLSMDEIAAAAGTSKSIFYRYFTDKTGLQQAVGAAVVGRIHAALLAAGGAARDPRSALGAMVAEYLGMIESSPHVYRFVTAPGAASTPVHHFLPAVATLVARPFLARTGPDRAPLVTAWSLGAVGFVRGIGEWWLALDPAERPGRAEVTDHVTAWLWSGPTPEPGPGPVHPPSSLSVPPVEESS